MPQSLADPRSLQSLERKLRGLLDVELSSWLPWSRDTSRPFISEALKSVGEWVSEEDLFKLLVGGFIKCCPTVLGAAGGRFYEITPPEEVEAFISFILDELKGLPRTYSVAFPTPQLKRTPGLSDLVLSNRIVVKSDVELRLSPLLLPVKQSVIEVQAIGYANKDRHETAMRDAISAFKVACHIGTTAGLFVPMGAWTAAAQGIGLLPNQAETAYSAIVFDSREQQSLIPLGSGISRYLHTLTVARQWTVPKIAELTKDVQELLHVLYLPEAQENVRSLRRAIEWAFDAHIDDDNTTRFLKTCIGLEAALTEQNEEIGITQQLADRCAFLMNKTVVAREETRKLVKEIYKLRSKIVHGAVDGLSPRQANLSQKTTAILSTVIAVELKGVRDWYRKMA